MDQKRLLPILAGSIILLTVYIAAFIFFRQQKHLSDTRTNKGILYINKTKIDVQVASALFEKKQGLSGKPSIEKNEGMLFIYKKDGKYGYWMKNMNFPIDIIWIDSNFQIVEISENIPPESFPQSFKSEKPIRYVLEISANLAKDKQISVGDRVDGIKEILENLH